MGLLYKQGLRKCETWQIRARRTFPCACIRIMCGWPGVQVTPDLHSTFPIYMSADSACRPRLLLRIDWNLFSDSLENKAIVASTLHTTLWWNGLALLF